MADRVHEENPFAPGSSPFRARGSVYTGALEYYDRRIPGGRQAVLAALAPTQRTFFNRPFLAVDVYDALPLVPLSTTAARLGGLGFAELVREAAAYAAERDLHTLYRVLFHMIPLEMVALRLTKVSMRYFDFGGAEAKKLGDKLCAAWQTGVPEVLGPWFSGSVEGFVPVALRKAGAHTARVVSEAPEPDGTQHGLPTVRLSFQFSWT